MRTDIQIRFTCAECGAELEASNDREKSKLEFNSAFHAGVNMAIIPCRVCSDRSSRPARLLRDAIRELELSDPEESLKYHT